MDKIAYNHNRLVIFDINVTKTMWLTWLNVFVQND
jgi:hypothetical protein